MAMTPFVILVRSQRQGPGCGLSPHPARLWLVLVPFTRGAGLGQARACDGAALPEGDSGRRGGSPARATLAWRVLPLPGPSQEQKFFFLQILLESTGLA